MAANNWIDLRSDTVTKPGAAMRAAMAAAEVGDDVFGDDPTVNRLQASLAERFGYEAGLFLPTGTQSNLCGLLAHCGRGDEYIVGQEAHTYQYEGGGGAVFGSIQPQPLDNAADGSIPLDRIARAIKPDDDHFPRTRLLALENTISGRVLPAPYLREATALAHERGLATHLDGARLYNAIVANGLHKRPGGEREAVAGFDSVSICISKGLGAPAGSVLLGTRELIKRAHRWRKVAGGGMRQAGVLAAACLYALEHHVARLEDDHRNAARLGGGLAEAGYETKVFTNMAFVNVPSVDVAPLQEHLRGAGILARVGPQMRLVTHLDLDAQQVERVIAVMAAFKGKGR
jgi:threonine aldolase